MTTGGLTFRPWRARGVDDLAPHARNPNIWRNLNDDAESWLAVNPLLVGPPIHFAVDLDGSPVGGVGMDLLDDDIPTAKIGYWVAEPYSGRGIGTAAVVFISDYARRNFPVERLRASAFEWNTASCRVLEKAGYPLEARLPRTATKSGRVGDLLVYAQSVRPDRTVSRERVLPIRW